MNKRLSFSILKVFFLLIFIIDSAYAQTEGVGVGAVTTVEVIRAQIPITFGDYFILLILLIGVVSIFYWIMRFVKYIKKAKGKR